MKCTWTQRTNTKVIYCLYHIEPKTFGLLLVEQKLKLEGQVADMEY